MRTTIRLSYMAGETDGRVAWMLTEAGVVIFNVIRGRLHKKARLEVLLDDAYWPAFSTIRARSTNAQWEYIGEGVVKELDFSRVWLRLNDAEEGDKDDVIAEWKGDTKAFLDKTLVRCVCLCDAMRTDDCIGWPDRVHACAPRRRGKAICRYDRGKVLARAYQARSQRKCQQ